MDDRPNNSLDRSRKKDVDYPQKMAMMNMVMICVGFLVCMQTLAFNVAIEGFLGGEDNLITPAIVISGVCLLGTGWLLRGLSKL